MKLCHYCQIITVGPSEYIRENYMNKGIIDDIEMKECCKDHQNGYLLLLEWQLEVFESDIDKRKVLCGVIRDLMVNLDFRGIEIVFKLYKRVFNESIEIDNNIMELCLLYSDSEYDLKDTVDDLLYFIEKSLLYHKCGKIVWGTKYQQSDQIELNILYSSSTIIFNLLHSTQYDGKVRHFLNLVHQSITKEGELVLLKHVKYSTITDYRYTFKSAILKYNAYFIDKPLNVVYKSHLLPICDLNFMYADTLLAIYASELTKLDYFSDLLPLSKNPISSLFSIVLDISSSEYIINKNSIYFMTLLDTFNHFHPHSSLFLSQLKYKCSNELMLNVFPISVINTIPWLFSFFKATQQSTVNAFLELLCSFLDNYYSKFQSEYLFILRQVLLMLKSAPLATVRYIICIIDQILNFLDQLQLDKSTLDELILSLDQSLVKYPSIAPQIIQSIHVFTHLCQLNASRILPSILNSIMKSSGHSNAGIPLLEYLSTLTNLPIVFKNLNQSDFKLIFAISLQLMSTTTSTYTVHLAFHVIDTFACHIQSIDIDFCLERMQLVLMKNPTLKQRILICLDFLSRRVMHIPTHSIEPHHSTVYSCGHSLLSILNNKLLIRRPSGTTIVSIDEVNHKSDSYATAIVPHVELSPSAWRFKRKPSFRKSVNPIQDFVNELPNNCFINDKRRIQDLIYCQSAAHSLCDSLFMGLLELSPSLQRTLTVLDYTPILDVYKFGVVYISKDMVSENDILTSQTMPSHFMTIYEQLGTYRPSSTIGGLSDSDGIQHIVWEDLITKMVFINSTLCPTTVPHAKMRLIGNCRVVLVFKDIDAPFIRLNSELIKAYFIIEPKNDLFQLSLHYLGNKGPLCIPRCMSIDKIGLFIRQLMLHCAVEEDILIMEDHITDWRKRLELIQLISK